MSIKLLEENEIGFGLLVEKDAGSINTDLYNELIKENETKFDFKESSTEPIYYYATLQKYGVENRNGRIYPEDILRREVERYQEIIDRNSSFHELDHPSDSVISLKGGSPHRIVELFWRENVLIGKLEILVSEGYRKSGIISCDGDLVAHYLSYGMTLGISSRGIGTLKKIKGQNIVQDDFELICWDIVSSPSTPGSYLYKNPNDFKTFDEVLPTDDNKKEKKVEIKNNDDDLINKLSQFLKK